MNKNMAVFFSLISLCFILVVGLSILYLKIEPSTHIIQEKTIDEYIIINIHLGQSLDGSTFFLFDYAKNGEPMTVYLPSPESVETFTNRLELLGSVIWLCDEPTTP